MTQKASNVPQSSAPDTLPSLDVLQTEPSPATRLDASNEYLSQLCHRTVGDSKHYKTLKASGELSPNETYAQAARQLLDDPESANTIDRFDRSLIELSTRLGAFIAAGLSLDNLRDSNRLSDLEVKEMHCIKEQEVIPFNHEIKELISDFPELGAKALARNMTTTYNEVFSDEYLQTNRKQSRGYELRPQDVAYEFEATVNGMRHEIAAESLLSAASIDYDYRISAEEDSTGSDLFVYLDSAWVGIDVKASFNAERRAYGHRRNSHAVWTTLHDEDFRGPTDDREDCVSISYQTAQNHSLEFNRRVYRAASGELRQDHLDNDYVNRRGRKALRAVHHYR